MIKVVFFAALREQLDCSEVNISSKHIETVADVKQQLSDKNTSWQDILHNGSLLSAVNHDMVDSSYPVRSGDEVAFFPPVTGG
jgi:molybdopterin synthase sulfur carrier subunit